MTRRRRRRRRQPFRIHKQELPILPHLISSHRGVDRARDGAGGRRADSLHVHPSTGLPGATAQSVRWVSSEMAGFIFVLFSSFWGEKRARGGGVIECFACGSYHRTKWDTSSDLKSAGYKMVIIEYLGIKG